MSILFRRVSAEELTKCVLYCERLVYAAWRMQDSMSSLPQSVGAREKVLQLMHRSPSSQFLLKGVKFQELTGCVEFANIYINDIPLKEMDVSWLRDKIGFVGKGKSSIAIASAILRDPEILVLDEATSSLDVESESYMEEVLHCLKNDSRKLTIIIIAHRLSSVKGADRILVMDDGHIVVEKCLICSSIQ